MHKLDKFVEEANRLELIAVLQVIRLLALGATAKVNELTVDQLSYGLVLFVFAFVGGISRALANGNYKGWRQVLSVGLFSGCCGFAVCAIVGQVSPEKSGLFPLGMSTAVGMAGYSFHVRILSTIFTRLGILPDDKPKNARAGK